jgi:hypothetical protein
MGKIRYNEEQGELEMGVRATERHRFNAKYTGYCGLTENNVIGLIDDQNNTDLFEITYEDNGAIQDVKEI